MCEAGQTIFDFPLEILPLIINYELQKEPCIIAVVCSSHSLSFSLAGIRAGLAPAVETKESGFL